MVLFLGTAWVGLYGIKGKREREKGKTVCDFRD